MKIASVSGIQCSSCCAKIVAKYIVDDMLQILRAYNEFTGRHTREIRELENCNNISVLIGREKKFYALKIYCDNRLVIHNIYPKLSYIFGMIDWRSEEIEEHIKRVCGEEAAEEFANLMEEAYYKESFRRVGSWRKEQ